MAIFNSYVIPRGYHHYTEMNHWTIILSSQSYTQKKTCPGTPADQLDHDERRNLWKCPMYGDTGIPPNLWIFMDMCGYLWLFVGCYGWDLFMNSYGKWMASCINYPSGFERGELENHRLEFRYPKKHLLRPSSMAMWKYTEAIRQIGENLEYGWYDEWFMENTYGLETSVSMHKKCMFLCTNRIE